MRVCIVAIPLSARSGVYMSSKELVEAARRMGLDWSAVVGMRTDQGLRPITGDQEHFYEEWIDSRSVAQRMRSSWKMIRTHPAINSADVVLSFIPLSDIILSLRRGSHKPTWIAFVRGLPWPNRGETSRLRRAFWYTLESRALRKALEVWATTDVLSAQLKPVTSTVIVPAGIKPTRQLAAGMTTSGKVVWAGRMAVDKNPSLFLQMMSEVQHPAVMYGGGAMKPALLEAAPPNVTISDWVDPEDLWQDASVFVGTSNREAFGRSAVEAAYSGLPVILGNEYGAANLLVTDPTLRERYVLPVDSPPQWIAALKRLLTDDSERARLATHVASNAQGLTIEASVRAVQARLASLGIRKG